MNDLNGIVTLNDLPEKEIFVETKPEFRKDLCQTLKQRGNIKRISRETQVSDRILYHWLDDGSMLRLDIFKKLAILFGKNSEQEILSFRGSNGGKIKNPKIPFDFTTKEGSRVVAAILGDGCLDKKYRLFYTNSNSKSINGFINEMKKIFGDIEFDIRKKSDSNVKIISLAPVYGRVISKLGVIPGKKVVINPKIPKFIFKLNEEKIYSFLSQIIDDEGSASIPSRHIRIKFATIETEIQSNIVSDLERLFLKLGIETTIYQIGGYESSTGIDRKNWQIEIHSFEQLKKLLFNLRLRDNEKKQKLEKLVNSIHTFQYPNKKCTEIYLSKMRKIQETKSFFTSQDLYREIDRSLGHTQNMIHKYHSKGLVKKIINVSSDGTRFYPAKYMVI